MHSFWRPAGLLAAVIALCAGAAGAGETRGDDGHVVGWSAYGEARTGTALRPRGLEPDSARPAGDAQTRSDPAQGNTARINPAQSNPAQDAGAQSATLLMPKISQSSRTLVDVEGLRARQAALFERMLAEPDNLEVMFEYALVSMQVEDYEAAISTLERMLIYRQDLSRVRLELAVSYFNLGSYEVAELYFDQVLADPETPDEVRAKIARYKEAIETRTARSAFSLRASLGLTYATNATLGPDDVIRVLGLPASVVAGGAEDDFGVRGLVNLTHVVDLERATDDVWITDAGFFGLQYFDEEQGNVLFGRLRTGPRLALDGQSFGPKLRPFGELSYLHGADEAVYIAYGGGLQYSNTIDQNWSVFSELALNQRNFDIGDFDDESALALDSLWGVSYVPVRDSVLRATLIAERDFAEADFNSNFEIGMRLSGDYAYESGFESVDEKWVFSAYAELRGRFFDDPEPVVDPNTTRRDLDLRGGISNLFALQDGLGLRLDVEGLLRESTVDNFDLDNISVTLSAEYRL